MTSLQAGGRNEAPLDRNTSGIDHDGGLLVRTAQRFTAWAERWFPDAYVFVALSVVVVASAAMLNGASPNAVAKSFGDGFWSLIVFALQVSMVAISGYVVAHSPPMLRLIDWCAALPRSGRAAVAFVATVSMLGSLLNWSISLIFSALLARALGRRRDLRMDYRAAGAASYLGIGTTWALGLSSAPAQLQANAGSLPKPVLQITGVIPLSDTIFLWQSMVMTLVLTAVAVVVCWFSAPSDERAVTASELGIDLADASSPADAGRRERPGEWLEQSPLLTILIVALGVLWIVQEFRTKDPILAISNLNTYNFIFFMLALLLHWRPKSFLTSFTCAVPAIAGVLSQFPLYAGVAAILTTAVGHGGRTTSDVLAQFFVQITTADTFPVVMGIYSAVLGFFIPSGGGKWIIEAPYVIQAAKDLQVNLGWAVQIYNAAEALPNLINPFWMLPVLGVLALRAKDIVGYTFLQFLVHTPVVLFLLWLFAKTLPFVPPVIPQ